MVNYRFYVGGGVNWIGLWTLYVKEVQRFLKVPLQTIIAPVVTSLLFLSIFSLAFADRSRFVGELPYLDFLAPGLIMMTVVQNAFANTSSSIMIAKIQGNIVDVLMPPLSPNELTLAYAAGGATRGIIVAAIVGVMMAPFIDLQISNFISLLYFSVSASFLLSLAGIAAGIWAEKFDHMSTVSNFIITPLSFLSGTFYSIERLPIFLRDASEINPFFYMIDGFRFGFIGQSDGSVMIGLIYLILLSIIFWGISYILFKKGYKIKS